MPSARPEYAPIAHLTYVRLVPLSEEGKRRWREARHRPETLSLALIFCTGQSGRNDAVPPPTPPEAEACCRPRVGPRM